MAKITSTSSVLVEEIESEAEEYIFCLVWMLYGIRIWWFRSVPAEEIYIYINRNTEIFCNNFCKNPYIG